MAASASLSTTFSLYSPHRLSPSSSRPTKLLSLQHTINQQFVDLGIPPISTTLSSSSSSSSSSVHILNSYNPRILNNGYMNERRSIFKASVSAQQENHPHQTNDEDESSSNELEGPANAAYPLSLKSLMQAYKEAVLYGDGKTIYEVEDIIFMMEKEKNELAQKVSSLSAEISSGKEKFVRLQADFDNYRKRSEKERLTVRSDAQGEVIESLLPMVDSFERAKQHLKLETEMEKKIDTSYQGIYKQFVEIMRSLRVAAVPTVGKPFDPSMHEAIAREESQEFKEGIIIQEFRRGFCLGDRLLRPAMVKVSSGPGKRKPSSVPEQPSEQPASVAGIDNL